MKKANDTPSLSRRKFLQQSAATGGMAALAAGAPALANTETPIGQKDERETKEEGYRLTQHILDYYKSTTL